MPRATRCRSGMCVDAGYATQDVYAWVRQHPQASWGPAGAAARQPRSAAAVKGRDHDTALLLSVSRADAGGKRRGLRVWSVGTPIAKGELYRWLKLEWPTEEALDDGASYPLGACHFPQYGEECFKQLTAERLVTRIVKGASRAAPGRKSRAGVTRHSIAECMPEPRPRSTALTASRSATGGGWRRRWRVVRNGMITTRRRSERPWCARRHGRSSTAATWRADMATVAEMEARLEALRAQRDSAVARVSYDGRSVEYRGSAEIARAIAELERELQALEGDAPVRQIRIYTSKGL